MRNKGLLITTVCLGIGAGAVVLLDRQKAKEKDARLGQVLLTPEAGANADLIEITKGDKVVKLVRDAGNVWHLGEASGFPADAQKVVRLIDDLGRARYSVLASSKAEKLGEFGLTSPTKLSITAKGGKSLDVSLGDNRTAGGIYVAPAGEGKAYVVDPAIVASSDVEHWELKVLVDVKKEHVKSVAFFHDDGAAPVTVERAKPEEPLKVVGLKEPQKDKPAVAQLDTLLQSVSFSKRLDPSNEEAKGALAKPSKAFVTLFDGRTYEVQVGSVGSKWFIKILADKHGAQLDAAAAAELERLQQLMAASAFELPAYVAQKFVKKSEDLVESPAPAASAPEAPSVESKG